MGSWGKDSLPVRFGLKMKSAILGAGPRSVIASMEVWGVGGDHTCV